MPAAATRDSDPSRTEPVRTAAPGRRAVRDRTATGAALGEPVGDRVRAILTIPSESSEGPSESRPPAGRSQPIGGARRPSEPAIRVARRNRLGLETSRPHALARAVSRAGRGAVASRRGSEKLILFETAQNNLNNYFNIIITVSSPVANPLERARSARRPRAVPGKTRPTPARARPPSQAHPRLAAAEPLQQVLNKVAAERSRRRGAAQAGVEGHGEGEGEGRVEGPAGRRWVRSRALRTSRAGYRRT